MKRMVSIVVLLAAAWSLALASEIPGDARRQIQEANAAWLPAMQRQDASAVAEPYADDAVFVTPTGEIATGRGGIERLMRERFAVTTVTGGRLVQDGMQMEGALIYEWGHAEMQVTRKNGESANATGRYLTVWKRDAKGRWRIIRNLSLAD